MKMKKTKYLNRTIWVTTMLGYFALLTLLLVSDTYLILESLQNRTKQQEELLNQCVLETEDAMQDIEGFMYDIYFSNENFEILSKELSDIEEYSNAYELQYTLRQKMMMDENLHGFYVFYGEKCWYNVNTDCVQPNQAPVLKETLEGLKRSQAASGFFRSWDTVLAGNETFLALRGRKENVTVYVVYNLEIIEKKDTGKCER